MSKGHVPEDNLLRYRRLMHLSRSFDTLGNQIGAMDMEDSRTCWQLSTKYRAMAQKLRADIPQKKEANE